jgi:hypothetical protein
MIAVCVAPKTDQRQELKNCETRATTGINIKSIKRYDSCLFLQKRLCTGY